MKARLGADFLDDLPVPADQLTIAGKYTVIETIARGGMGVVYKARQENLNRIVAVKMLLGGVHAGEDYKRRFLQEAKAAAQLNHPSIVAIHDWGEDAGQPYFSMDYIDGQTLADMARERPMPSRAAAQIVCTIATAISHAHERGVLHRDLKPSNVLIDSAGVARVTDFGLARNLNHDTVLTLSGDLLGTPGYLPPEQISARREQIGPPSDVYGLGAILYYLLTSRPPHVAGSATEALRAVAEDEPVQPRRLNASVPRDLETICLKCLEKAPARRYATASALAAELGRWLNGEAILAQPASGWTRVVKWSRRKPALAMAIAFSTLVLGVGVAGVTWQWQRAETAYRAALQAAQSEQAAQLVAQTKRLEAEEALARLKATQAELAEAYRETIRAANAEAEARKFGEQKLAEARAARLEAERIEEEAEKAASQAEAAQKESADSVLALASANQELTTLQLQSLHLADELKIKKALLFEAEKRLLEFQAASLSNAVSPAASRTPSTAVPFKQVISSPRTAEQKPSREKSPGSGGGFIIQKDRIFRNRSEEADPVNKSPRQEIARNPRMIMEVGLRSQSTRSNAVEQTLFATALLRDFLEASNEAAVVRLHITNLVRKLPNLQEASLRTEIDSAQLTESAVNAREMASRALEKAARAEDHAMPFVAETKTRSAAFEAAKRKLESLLQAAQQPLTNVTGRSGQ